MRGKDAVEAWDEFGSVLYNTIINLAYLSESHTIKKILRRNTKLKKQYEGQRCFIVLNGPSTKAYDLSYLKDEYVFVANHMYMIDEVINTISPDFYCAIDENFFTDKLKYHIFAMQEKCKDSTFFFSTKFLNISDNIPDNVYLTYSKHRPHQKKVANNISAVSSIFANVAFYVINIALYLGFKEIYILGLDFAPTQSGWDYLDKRIDETQTKDFKDSGSFSTLREKKSSICGGWWYYAQAHYQSFYVRSLADHMGCKIYNLNPNSNIHAFEWADYNEIIKR